jgi:hypothetical protein
VALEVKKVVVVVKNLEVKKEVTPAVSGPSLVTNATTHWTAENGICNTRARDK